MPNDEKWPPDPKEVPEGVVNVRPVSEQRVAIRPARKEWPVRDDVNLGIDGIFSVNRRENFDNKGMKVFTGGRSFVVDAASRPVIFTAAHCLGTAARCSGEGLPPAHAASYTEERTYPNFLGPLDEVSTISVECLYADPIADIAIVGEPEGQKFPEQQKDYDNLLENSPRLQIADAPMQCTAWLLSIEKQWFRCTAERVRDGNLILSEREEPIESGMSGSPILNRDGAAIGILTTDDSPNPGFPGNLPVWVWQQLG